MAEYHRNEWPTIGRNMYKGTCSYCGNEGSVIDLTDFVEFVGGRLSEYLQDLDSADLPLASGLFEDDQESAAGRLRSWLESSL